MNGVAAYRQIEQSSRVEGASPHALVSILLGEAIEQIDAMGAAFGRGQRAHRAMARAQGILHALEASLDHKAGGTTAGLMAQVYGETRRCLSRAADELDPLWCKRAHETLRPVAEAWNQIAQAA